MQHDAQERRLDLDASVVVDVPHLPKFVHKEIDASSRRADDFGERRMEPVSAQPAVEKHPWFRTAPGAVRLYRDRMSGSWPRASADKTHHRCSTTRGCCQRETGSRWRQRLSRRIPASRSRTRDQGRIVEALRPARSDSSLSPLHPHRTPNPSEHLRSPRWTQTPRATMTRTDVEHASRTSERRWAFACACRLVDADTRPVAAAVDARQAGGLWVAGPLLAW